MKKRIYTFGNEYLEFDNIAVKVAKKLDKSRFDIVQCTSPEEILYADDRQITILDAVSNADKTTIINDVSKIKTRKIMTMHDFDLGFFLNLMKEMKINKKIKIIGIPQKGNVSSILKEVQECI